jgi:excisionase family DNA binding protein
MAKRPDLRTIDIDVAAEVLATSRSAVRRLIESGKLRSIVSTEGRRRVRVFWTSVQAEHERRVFAALTAKP